MSGNNQYQRQFVPAPVVASTPRIWGRTGVSKTSVSWVASDNTRRALAAASLSESEQADLRSAGNSKTGPRELGRLAAHRRWLVREAVAANPHCSSGTLDRLIRDPYRAVAQAAADNPGTSQAARAMWQLAH